MALIDTGFVPTILDDSLQVWIGSPAVGRATASSTTLDNVVFTKLPGQAVATTFTPADVGCPIAIIGGGPVNALMPAPYFVQGELFHTTIAAYVSPTQVTLANAPDTSIYNTGFVTVICYRRCLFQLDQISYTGSIAPGTRDTLDFTVLARDNEYIERFTTIAMGQPVYFRSSDPEVGDIFGGEIDTITASNMVGTTGTFSWQCHCAGWDGIAGRRVVSPAIPRVFTGPPAEVFTKIVLFYMGDEGVAADAPAGGDDITVGCPVGAHVDKLLDECVQKLSSSSQEWYWYADAWRRFTLAQRSTTPAPWDIDDGQDLLAGQTPIQLQITRTHDKLANFVYAIGSQVLINGLRATFNGTPDGRTTFDLPQVIAKVPTITLNGNPQTVGILGVETGKDWYWNQGSTTLTQDAGGVVLTPADALLVAYTTAIPGVAQAPNSGSLSERSADEATSGQFDYTIQVSQPIDPQDLLTLAATYAAQYGQPAQTCKISTLRPGIRAGQLQHIVLPDIGVDGDFLVATVKLGTRNKVIQWDYSAYSGANVGTGITGLVQFINRGEATLSLLTELDPITGDVDAEPVVGQNVTGRTVFGVGLTFPNSVQKGNLLIMVAERNTVLGNPPATTDSQGNTWHQAIFAQTGGGFPNQISLMYTFASASGTLEVFCSSAEWQALMEFENIDESNPIELSDFAIGTTPPALNITDDGDVVVTGLANVTTAPTVTGAEVLLGYRLNTGQPGVAYSYAKPGTGSFTSSLRDSGGSSASVFVSVAFRRQPASQPPAQTVEVLGNPQGNVSAAAALTADQPVFGDGNAAVKSGTKTGTTNEVVTASGTQTLGHPLIYDANGNAADGDPGQLVPAGGGTGYVLTKDSGMDFDTSWQPAGGGGSGALILLETKTANNTSGELDFTASITSSYDEYLIEIVGLVNGSAAALKWQMSTNGGSTYDTGNNYDYGASYQFNGGGVGQFGTNGTSGIFHHSNNLSLGSGGSWSASWRLYNPLSTSIYKQMVGTWMMRDSGVGVLGATNIGSYNNTSAVDAFRLIATAGNLVSGVVRVYGIAK